ncbi:unnamed protein product, partial [Brassica oleracea var. botrytis]
QKYILIAFVFTLFFAMSIVRCTDLFQSSFLHNFNILLFFTIRIDFGVKYNVCYGPCDDKGVCTPFCSSKKGLKRGDCVGKAKGYLGTCCCYEH